MIDHAGLAALGAVAHYIVTVSIVGIIVGGFAYLVAVFAGKVRFTDYARQIAPVQAFAVSTQRRNACMITDASLHTNTAHDVAGHANG